MKNNPLTILMIDKYYFIKGGAERYMFELTGLLESRGHRVIPFSMAHPENHQTEWSKYFVSHMDLMGETKSSSLWNGIRYTMRAIYSTEAKKCLKRLVQETRPDIAHLHMIDHQLSPSILGPLRSAGIPTIQTVHQYKSVCPNYRLYNERTNEICELCVKGSAWNALRTRCHKGSLAASGSVALETSIHRALGMNKKIDLWHTPSAFMASKLLEGGYPKDRVVTFPYTIDVESYPYFEEATEELVYCGRLSHEKGLETLLSAMARLPERRLVIVGQGPSEKVLKDRADREGLKNVQFRGWLKDRELHEAIGRSALQVVPSEWYENSPLSIYESLSLGTPVLGSRRGGIPDLIPEGTGGLFESGNVDDLVAQIKNLFSDPTRLNSMRRMVRDHALSQFGFSAHAERIEGCYDNLLGREQSGDRHSSTRPQKDQPSTRLRGVES